MQCPRTSGRAGMVDGERAAVVPDEVLRFRAEMAAQQAGELDRLTEPPAVRAERRDRRLRDLVVHAQQHSSWYRERLAKVDVDGLSGDDLSSLPTMTKIEMMEHWDDFVCDPKLTLAGVTAHLDTMARRGPCLLADRYLPMVTGGSTGTRGVFVWALEDLRAHLGATGRAAAWTAARRQPP